MGKNRKKSGKPTPAVVAGGRDTLSLGRRHLVFGWWSLLFFLCLGILLEMLHGFKIGWYLNVSNESRRLMFTLAHSHGTLVALVNIAAGMTIRLVPDCSPVWRRFGSPALIGSSILLPGGFLLGGLVILGGDPGYGIVLVPVGALLLFVGVILTAQQASSIQAAAVGKPVDK